MSASDQQHGQLIGYFYVWWRDDPLPVLAPRPELHVTRSEDVALLARLAHLEQAEVQTRLADGHRLYLAWLNGQPIGYGWVAARRGAIPELGLWFDLPKGAVYLWDFVTLEAWRGQGIYPHLLQAIIQQEQTITQFWIGHDASNAASGRGILKAGFARSGALHAFEDGLAVVAGQHEPRAALAAHVFGLDVKT